MLIPKLWNQCRKTYEGLYIQCTTSEMASEVNQVTRKYTSCCYFQLH